MSEPADSAAPPPGPLWAPPVEGKLMGRGHPVGDFLEAYDWDLLEQRDGLLRVAAHLPAQVKNPRGHLFGGFTGTYVDFLALHTFWAGREPRPGNPWLATVNMRIDYFAPVVGARFVMEGRVVRRTESICSVEARFLDVADAAEAPGPEGESASMLVFAYTTLKIVR
jgi:acyl-coenzyme A thioesterase PaaI-like protein